MLARVVAALSQRPWLANGLSLLLGLVYARSFAPVPSALVALLCLSGVYALTSVVYRNTQRWPDAARLGFCFGLGWFGYGISWIYISLHHHGELAAVLSALATLALASLLSLFPGAALGGAFALSPRHGWQRVIALTCCWTLAELLRGTVLGGFPWLSGGYAHTDGVLAGYAPVLGVYGVGAMATACAALLLQTGSKTAAQSGPARLATLMPTAKVVTVLACILTTGFALKNHHWSQAQGAPMRVRLVQGNIPQDLKFGDDGLERAETVYLGSLPTPAGTPKPDLIVFPESAFPVPINDLPNYDLEQLFDERLRQGAGLVFGVFIVEPGQRYFNSAVGLTQNDVDPQRYSKHHLVPFGEFVPFGMHWFVRLLQIPIGDQHQGAETQTPMLIAGQRIAVNICFEDLFGEEIRHAWQDPRNAPSVLLNLSNLAWFDDSVALQQHLQISRMRTLETARPLLQVTNTGLTVAIDDGAHVLAQLPPLQTATLSATIQPMQGSTPYVRWGNTPVWLFALTGVLLVSWLGWQQKDKR